MIPKSKVVLISLSFLFLSTYCSVAYAGNDNQSILLDYYGNQLVSHAGSLFAVTSASFVFMSSFARRHLQKRERYSLKLFFVFFNAILFSLTMYIGSRLILYGFLASGVIHLSPLEGQSLAEYRSAVCDTVLHEGTTFNVNPYVRNFINVFMSSWGEFPYIITFCLLIGFFLAYLTFLSISEEEHTKERWIIFVFLFILVIIKIVFVMGILRTHFPIASCDTRNLWSLYSILALPCTVLLVMWTLRHVDKKEVLLKKSQINDTLDKLIEAAEQITKRQTD